MSDKEYFKQLKESDYFAWDSIVNDPMIKGEDSGTPFVFYLIIIIIFVSCFCYFL